MNPKIAYLKNEIKRLTPIQRNLKGSRKKDKRGSQNVNDIQWDIYRNRLRATAILNLMHSIKESEYRHNVKEGNLWQYKRTQDKLQLELDAVCHEEKD